MKYLRLIAAIIVACIGGVVFWSKPWYRLQSAFDLLWHSRHEKKVTDNIYGKRLDKCRVCPVFYHPLKTCGSPLRNHDLGCWCSMIWKAKLKAADCWLRTKCSDNKELMKYAWPKGL